MFKVKFMRIMLISDIKASHYLCSQLERFSHEVDLFVEPVDGEMSLHTVPYCIVILAMPFKRNICILERLRKCKVWTPIILLNESIGSNEKALALNFGADDCMSYPFDIEELVARLYAIVRRSCGEASPYIYNGDIRFDTISREVFFQGEKIELTSRETALLEIFLLNKKRLLSKSHLQDKIFSWKREVNSNVVEVHISALRKKLGYGLIHTVHGQGYRLSHFSEKSR
ncbi:response regulator transcription factor [Salmonella enterica subsp. enterica serovar Ank]|nr:response regulator transcription factor [Salmonella enterica subsp. enterica serovar Ank]